MRVGFYGGSFDPPHCGHLVVAQAAARAFHLDEVLFAPTGLQPLKPQGTVATFKQRLEMTGLLCASSDCSHAERLADTRVKVSPLDAPRFDGQPNFTVDTLRLLQKELPMEAELYCVVGADAFLDFRRWRSPDELLVLAEWIVLSRPGFSLGKLNPLGLTATQRTRVHVLDGIADPTSATAVRAALRSGADVRGLMPAAVLAYIAEHGLYSGA